jgi:glutamate synthase domain-containing protein 2
MELMDNVGLPLKEALPIVVDKIIQNGLKDRIKVIASGKLITPADVAWAVCAGADFVTSARGFMFAIGCIQSLKCNKNTCPTGITTHNKRLQKGLNPINKADKVAEYVSGISIALQTIAHSCGVKEVRMLNKTHVRIVQNDGKSIPMAELCPLCVEGENK